MGDRDGRYAGDVEPVDVYETLRSDPSAVLVDVRTKAEWHYVGTPVLDEVGKKALFLEWQDYPSGTIDTDFVDKLIARGVSRDAPVYFLCRSGVRSRHAAIAATEAAFTHAYNVAHGFEGPVGPDGTRSASGWKVDGLPWRHS